MVKSISSGLSTHLGQETTTLARCWSITRTDGVAFYFTDLDADLVIDGNTYKASLGLRASAVANNAGLDVDNLDVDGFFDDDSLTEEELRAGLFDYAEVKVFLVNWQDLSQGVLKIRRGHLGEVIFTQHGFFKAELRGLTQALQQKIGELYAPECRADLGDLRCKVPLGDASTGTSFWQANTAYAVGDKVMYDFGGSGTARLGNIYFECTTAGASLASAPSWNTTVGATTTEGGSPATGTCVFSGQPANNTFVSINGRQYLFQTTLTNVNGHVHIGATLADTIANLKNAINLGSGAGTDYAAATTANIWVSAADNGVDTVTVTALSNGTFANEYPLNDSVSGGWTAALMAGGLDGVTWTTRRAFIRDGAITSVTDRANFTISLTDSTGTPVDWFNGGFLKFESGQNNGRGLEVKTWDGVDAIEMYLPFGYLPQVGDLISIYPGCYKRVVDCRDKFNNLHNMRAEPYLPGQDQALSYPDAKA